MGPKAICREDLARGCWVPRYLFRAEHGRLGIALRVHQPVERVWAVFADTRLWPIWGPSVRSVTVIGSNDFIYKGMRGSVRTILGLSLPFEIDHVDPGRSWSWRVGGVKATGHEVLPEGPHASWIVFTVPLWGFFYLPVCLVAARRMSSLLRRLRASSPQAALIKGSSFSMEKNTANSNDSEPSAVDG